MRYVINLTLEVETNERHDTVEGVAANLASVIPALSAKEAHRLADDKQATWAAQVIVSPAHRIETDTTDW